LREAVERIMGDEDLAVAGGRGAGADRPSVSARLRLLPAPPADDERNGPGFGDRLGIVRSVRSAAGQPLKRSHCEVSPANR